MVSVQQPGVARANAVMLFCLLGMTAVPLPATSADHWPMHTQHLFHIQRSLNANIVQYDAVLNEDGTLDKNKPLIAYWIRKAEDGRRKNLSFMEKKLAYGFSARTLSDGSILMDTVIDLRRNVKVKRIDSQWVAVTRISGTSAILDHVYVKLFDKKNTTKVQYVELFGQDQQTGEKVHERFSVH